MRRAFSQALASLNWRSSAARVFWLGVVAMILLAAGLLGWLVCEVVFDWLDALD